MTEPEDTRTEAVAVFDDAGALQEAIDDLLSSGFDRAAISLVAGQHAVEEKLGHAYKRVAELEDDPAVPTVAYVSTESIGDAIGGLIGGLTYVGSLAVAGAIVASGGTLVGAAAGAAMAGGAAGLVGSVLGGLVGDHHARYLQEQLDHGGLLLWIRTRNRREEQRATDILSRHSAHDVHTHELHPIGD